MVYQSVMSYLDPERHVTPLIELLKLPQFISDKARIFMKMAPLGNIKTVPAHYMLTQAHRNGWLQGVHTLVEASSGNMAVALCDLCPYFGIENFLAIIANDTAQCKQQELHIKGAQIQFTNSLPKGMSAIGYAKKLGQQEGFLNLCQYGNPDNPEAYFKLLAPQIRSQLVEEGLGNKPFVFCTGMGSCGTLIGCGRYFLSINGQNRIIGVYLSPGEMVPGVRDSKRLEEITLSWRQIVDYCAEIGRYDSYKRQLELIHMGLNVGPSTGLAFQGLLEYLQIHEERKDVVAVFIAADSYKLYTDKPGTILKNEDLIKRMDSVV